MKMYRVNTMFSITTGFKLVNVDRETEQCVFINGCREHKQSRHYTYFNEFEPAKTYALRRAKDIVKYLEIDLIKAKKSLDKIEALTIDNCKSEGDEHV